MIIDKGDQSILAEASRSQYLRTVLSVAISVTFLLALQQASHFCFFLINRADVNESSSLTGAGYFVHSIRFTFADHSFCVRGEEKPFLVHGTFSSETTNA